MKILQLTRILGLASLLLLFVQCDDEIYFPDQETAAKSANAKKPSEETAGNNLSYPVLWADGVGKELRGTMDEYILDGEWWYVWGEDPIDPNYPVFSCQPSPSNPDLCIDATPPGDGISTVYKAYVQKDLMNTWQAFNAIPTDPVNVDLIDWGDDLESVNWSINSMVRAEVVLFETLDGETFIDKELSEYPQFPMRHVSGWGSNEVHGLQALNQAGEPQPAFDEVLGDMATVYSHNARFTIQKLNVDPESYIPATDPALDLLELTWDPEGKWTGDNINEPIFNKTVYESGDGPGYYNAEINVKGKVIYGYTWKVRTLNDEPGFYRLTFSLDKNSSVTLKTFFDENTEIVVPEEEEEEGDDDGNDAVRGGTGVIDVPNNLTYMDILITPKNSGGGKGGGNGGSGSGGSGSGGGGTGSGSGGDTGSGVPGGGKGGKR